MITRTHPLARRLRALRHDRALREHERVFVAEGIHLAQEALASGVSVELAVLAPRLLASPDGRRLEALLRSASFPVHDAADATLDLLQDARTPQPVLLLVRRAPALLDEVVGGRGEATLVVVACGVQDPGNLGAILRSADAAGATGLVAITGGADLFHPRTARASAGSIFRLPAIEADAESALAAIASSGAALTGAGPREGTRYDRFDWTKPIALALGGEGGGIPEPIARRLVGRVVIPMREGIESLSVGAAAAVLLFEARRQRTAR